MTLKGEISEDTYICIVTAYHLSIGHLVTQAVSGFVGVNGHVQYIRWVDIPEVGSGSAEFPSDNGMKKQEKKNETSLREDMQITVLR